MKKVSLLTTLFFATSMVTFQKVNAIIEPSTQKCNDSRKINLIITNNRLYKASGSASYEKSNTKTFPTPGASTKQVIVETFTVPAHNDTTKAPSIFCLPKKDLVYLSIVDSQFSKKDLTKDITLTLPKDYATLTITNKLPDNATIKKHSSRHPGTLGASTIKAGQTERINIEKDRWSSVSITIKGKSIKAINDFSKDQTVILE